MSAAWESRLRGRINAGFAIRSEPMRSGPGPNISCSELEPTVQGLNPSRPTESRFLPLQIAVKGHVILLPQDTTRLLDILLLPPASLPDIVRVVWVGRPVHSADSLNDHFSVRTQRVYDALLWLTRHNEDYKNVVIDRSEFERWPPVFVVQELLDQIGEVEDESAENDARTGVATEEMDTDDFEGDIPMTTSAIVDIAAVSQSSQLQAIQHISLWKNDATINVVTGNSILSEETLHCYFTAAFPSLFPWGTGKHIDNRRSDSLTLKKWIQLLIRNSSR